MTAVAKFVHRVNGSHIQCRREHLVDGLQATAATSLTRRPTRAPHLAASMALIGMLVSGVCLVIAKPLAAAGPARTPHTGTLRGRFVFDGTPPLRKKLPIEKDHVALDGKELFDESLLVGERGGVANVIVWLRDADVPVPPAKQPPPPATLRLRHARYDPHVLAITTAQTLLLVNDDPVGTSVIFSTQANPPRNLLLPRNSRTEHQFRWAERIPMIVTAAVHPWLKAYLLVCENPYFAITDEDGRFEIKHLPPGDWTFQCWHESAGYVKHRTGWPKGLLQVTIDNKGNDIGQVKLTADDFGLTARQTEAAPGQARGQTTGNAN